MSQIILICTISYFAGDCHWVCTSCASSGAMQIMDSFGLFMKMNVVTLLQISKIYPPSNSVLQLHKLSVQQQDGTLDCGLLLLLRWRCVWEAAWKM